jgi:hypothetical protein
LFECFRRNLNISEGIISEAIVSENGQMFQKKLFQKKILLKHYLNVSEEYLPANIDG